MYIVRKEGLENLTRIRYTEGKDGDRNAANDLPNMLVRKPWMMGDSRKTNIIQRYKNEEVAGRQRHQKMNTNL